MMLFDEALIRLRHDELKEQIRDGERQCRLRAALAVGTRRTPPHHRALAQLGRSLVRWGGRLQTRYGRPTTGQAFRAAGR